MKKILPFIMIVILLSACASTATPISPPPPDLNAYTPVPFEKAITFANSYQLDGKYIQVECRYEGVQNHKPFELPQEYKGEKWAGPIVLADNSGNSTWRAVMLKAKANTLSQLKPGDPMTVYARVELHLVGVWEASTIHYEHTPFLIISEIRKSSN